MKTINIRKKLYIILLVTFCFTCCINPNNAYASDSTSVSSSSWVEDAFSATKSFLTGEVIDNTGIAGNLLEIFTIIVKAINRILLVVLASVSAIALSLVGIRYIQGISNPGAVGKAKKDLHTVFKAMLYGFGAFFIWRIAMAIVSVIINAF